MKKILFFLMLILALSFILSCTPPNDKLVGVWVWTSTGNVIFKYTFESNKHYKVEIDPNTGVGFIERENGNYSFDDTTNRLTLNYEQKRPNMTAELENAPEGSFQTDTIAIDSTKMSVYDSYIGGNIETIVGEWKNYQAYSSDGITTTVIEETKNLKSDNSVEYTNVETVGTGQPTTETATATWSLDTVNSTITISNSSDTNLIEDGSYPYTIIDDALVMPRYSLSIFEKE